VVAPTDHRGGIAELCRHPLINDAERTVSQIFIAVGVAPALHDDRLVLEGITVAVFEFGDEVPRVPAIQHKGTSELSQLSFLRSSAKRRRQYPFFS